MEIWRSGHGGIIVIGAHRSGTSMMAGLLRSLGVHMGADCGVLEESAFFRGLNIRALRAAGASWCHPGPMRRALQDPRRQQQLAESLRRAVDTPARAGYFARPGGVRTFPVDGHVGAWGWKDPRTTITLPLWKLVFSRARVVHIVRNGVDVAHSLMERDRTVPAPTWKPLRYLGHRVWPRRWPEFRWRPFRDLQEAFDLWAEYVRFGVEATRSLTQSALFQIRYEDFVAAPHASVIRLADFLDMTDNVAVLQRLSTTVVKERRFAFSSDACLTDFYRQCQHHVMMRRFGYDHLA